MLSRYPLLRSAGAVLAGELCRLVLLGIFVIGLLMPAYEAAGWKPGSPVPDSPQVRNVLVLFLFWILLVVGPAGGYICAMLARRQYLAHGIALSLLALVIYALEVVNTPAGDKVTMFVVGTFLMIPTGIMGGAYLYSRRVSRQDRGISRTAGSAG